MLRLLQYANKPFPILFLEHQAYSESGFSIGKMVHLVSLSRKTVYQRDRARFYRNVKLGSAFRLRLDSIHFVESLQNDR